MLRTGLKEKLKEELSIVMCKFEAKEKRLSKEITLAICKIGEFMANAITTRELKENITDLLNNNIPYKFLSYFRNDLRRLLEAVLNKPVYQQKDLLLEENGFIQLENIQLKQEIGELKESIRQNNPELIEELANLSEQMDTEVKQKGLLKKEIEYLRQQIKSAQTKNNGSEAALIKAGENSALLSQKYATLLKENSQLYKENEKLKAVQSKFSINASNMKKEGYSKFYKM